MDVRECEPRSRAQDLIDQSQLQKRRARRRIAQSRGRIQRAKHRWQAIALGRVCEKCKMAQAKGEFDEFLPCVAS